MFWKHASRHAVLAPHGKVSVLETIVWSILAANIRIIRGTCAACAIRDVAVSITICVAICVAIGIAWNIAVSVIIVNTT